MAKGKGLEGLIGRVINEANETGDPVADSMRPNRRPPQPAAASPAVEPKTRLTSDDLDGYRNRWRGFVARAKHIGIGAKELGSSLSDDARTFMELLNDTPPGSNAYVKDALIDAITDEMSRIDHELTMLQERQFQQLQAQKKAWVPTPGEHGLIYVQRSKFDLAVASVQGRRPLLLVGEPGAGKTDFGRALAPATGRTLFHQEVSGLVEPGQIEAEQHIKNEGGVPVTTYTPTAFLRALEAACGEVGEARMDGVDVLLYFDELLRGDPMILNALMLLLSHWEYHAVVNGKTYKVPPGKLGVVASGNIDREFNFAGNNRRGLDDALADRFRFLRLERLPKELIGDVIRERVPHATEDVIQGCVDFYAMAEQPAQKRIITTRSVLDAADAWASLGSGAYRLSEVIGLILGPRTTDTATFAGIVGALEGKGL